MPLRAVPFRVDFLAKGLRVFLFEEEGSVAVAAAAHHQTPIPLPASFLGQGLARLSIDSYLRLTVQIA